MFVLFSVQIVLIEVILSDWNEGLCKIEYNLFYCARSFSCWLIVLIDASIDQQMFSAVVD